LSYPERESGKSRCLGDRKARGIEYVEARVRRSGRIRCGQIDGVSRGIDRYAPADHLRHREFADERKIAVVQDLERWLGLVDVAHIYAVHPRIERDRKPDLTRRHAPSRDD